MTRLAPRLLALAALAAAASAAAAPSSSRRLAFERAGNIWIADLDGSAARKLASGVDPALSPDGSAVAFTLDTSSKDGVHRAIAVADAASGQVRVLKDVPSDNAFGPAWSPDGTRLLFYLFVDGGWHAGLVASDGTGFRFVKKTASDGHACYSAAWASDGASFFCQDLDVLYRFDLDGKELWRAPLAALFPGAGLDSNARLDASPDGRALLVDVDLDEEAEVAGKDGPPPALYRVDLEAKTARRLTPAGLLAWDGSWLDGDTLLFTGQRKGERVPSVERLRLDGSPVARLVGDATQPSASRR